MNSMTVESTGESADESGGPMWGRFFESLGGGDTDSMVSGSHQPTDLPSRQPSMRSISVSHAPVSPNSDLHPNDSASGIMDDDNSALEGYSRPHNGHSTSFSGLLPSLVVDDGTYVFKFRTPSGRTHRFQARHDNYEHMREIISNKLAIDPFFTQYESTDPLASRPDPSDYQLAYTDADEDLVLITSDGDVADAVKMARSKGLDRVVLFIQGGRPWEEAMPEKADAKAAEAAAASVQNAREVEKVEEHAPQPAPAPALVPPPPDDLFGIPRDLLLPASIGILAASIVIVFTVSRLTSNNNY
jgi:PB1 domain